MRKAYRFLAAALSLVLCTGMQSCHNEKISSGYPILFRCADVTRAEATITDLQDNGFDVNAFFTANGSKFDFTKSLSYDNVSGIWGYNDIEYWLPGATYYFKALYPTDAGTIDNSTSAQSLTISNFDVTSQTDLLVAQTGAIDVDASIGSPTGGSVVYLQFKHLLANVVIAMKAEISGVEVKNISLVTVAQTGSYDDTKAVPWSTSQTTDIVKNNIDKTLSYNTVEYTDVTNGGFLVIPQVINGTQKLKIETSNKDYELVIPNITWSVGTQYIYTLTVQQNDILFDMPTIVKVDEWDEKNATGSVIIK